MNISTDLEAARQEAIQNAQRRDVTMLIFMVSLAVIGVVVNSVLLDVYLHTRRKVLSTYFITAVAAIDLIISGVAIPLSLLPSVIAVPVTVCAFCLSIRYGCVGISIMLFFCITFDRYQAVCLLQRPLITTQNLHFPKIWAFVSAVYAGIVAPIYLKGEITVLDDVEDEVNASEVMTRQVTLQMRPGYPCYSTALLSHPRRVWDARFIVQFIFAICCGSLILLVLVLYFFMFIKLRQKDQFRLQSLSYKGQKIPQPELQARPCCDMSDFPAISSANNSKEEKINDRDEHSSFTEVFTSCEEASTFPKCKLGVKHLFGQNARKWLEGNENFHSGNPAAEKKEKFLPNFVSLNRSTSALQPRELKKFRRRARVKVEPLYVGGTMEAKRKLGPKHPKPLNSLAKYAVTKCAAKLEKNNLEPSKIKIKRGTPFAALSCLKTRDNHSDIPKIQIKELSSQVESDTDSIQSEPEPCQDVLSVFPHPEGTNGIPNPIEKRDSTYCKTNFSASTDVIPRFRSFSCSAAEDVAKQRDFKTLAHDKDHGMSLVGVITGPRFVDVPPDLVRDVPGMEIKTADIIITTNVVPDSSSGQFDLVKQAQDKFIPQGNPDCVRLEKDILNSDLQTGNLSQDNYTPNNGTALDKKFLSLNKEIDRAEPPRLVRLREEKNSASFIKALKTKLMIGNGITNEALSHTAQTGEIKLRVKKRGKKRWKGSCGKFECNLSTRVTARVGLLTLAYCIWWLPFYLTELGLVQYGTLMPEILFMANVMNPLLHLMTSQVFRYQVRARIKVYWTRLSARWSKDSSKA